MTKACSLWICVACVVSFIPTNASWAYDPVVPGKAIEFPRDRGSHPGHRIEWWYVTGVVADAAGSGEAGFQVTFFRVRNPEAESNPSRFAPKQLLFAHAALSDPANRRIVHAQKSARMLEGLVEAREGETALRLDDWKLERTGTGYHALIQAADFSLDLDLAPTQAPMLQGERGFSRKGASPTHASYYYSEPHLAVSGTVVSLGKRRTIRGVAWLDHEWSSELLAEEAAGWDWLGANLEGGVALMAFRIRAKDGSTLWANAALRGVPVSRSSKQASQEAVDFRSLRTWKSPRTGIEYPVAMEVRVGERTWKLEPLLDDQELDARASTGTLYWEGAVRVSSPNAPGGVGYLELTGYGGKVPF